MRHPCPTDPDEGRVLVAAHNTGVTKLYRLCDGTLVRITDYPDKGRCSTVVDDYYLDRVRRWSTWTVFDRKEVDRGLQGSFPIA